jgi:hypothetical protein
MKKKNLISMFGWIGAISIISAYALLSFHVISDGLLYNLLNLIGALFVVVDAFDDKAYPPALINIAWFVVAFISLIF